MPNWLQEKRNTLLPPFLFLLVCILAYGIQAFQMGFYLDDWIILDAYNINGMQGLRDYAFFGNRPIVFWIWWVGFQFAQSDPARWQIWALVWRWLTVVILWMVCRLLWPRHDRQVTFACLLFTVYPLFKQQATALTFSFHWITFFLWGLSVYWMILAVRRPGRAVLYLTGSLVAGALQLFSQEYYVGLELLRPVVLWFALSDAGPGWKPRARRVFFAWLSFLLVFVGYYIWRTLLMPVPAADRNTPSVLYGLFTTPLSTLAKLVVMAVQNIVYILIGVWYASFEPGLYQLTPPANLVTWAIVAFVIVVMLALFWGSRKEPQEERPAEAWYRQALPFGFLAMVFGFLPGWMIGRHIYDLTGIYNDRFGLAAMFGAAILVIALIEMLLKTPAYRIVLACVLVGLGTGQNVRFETNYRWSAEKQSKLYWQWKWRAPEMVKPTSIYGEGSVASFVGGQVVSSAINLMYGPPRDTRLMDFRYFDVSKVDIDTIKEAHQPLSFSLGYMKYEAPAENNLVFTFEPEKLQCLWILSEKDQVNPYLSPAVLDAVELSNLSQILPESERSLRADIYGSEPAHDWCYYYQKGELAGQYKDWNRVVALWQEAQQNDKRPKVGTEYGVFIEGFAGSGDWNSALELTRQASFPKYEMRKYLCTTWRRISDAAPASEEKQQTITQVIEDFECQDEFRAP